MYGLPEGIDLTFLLGRTLMQVCIGLYQVRLNFDDEVSISIESDFTTEKGGKTNREHGVLPLSASSLLHFIGKAIDKIKVVPDGDLYLNFGDMDSITIFDSNQEFESYQIAHRTRVIIV